MKKLFIMLMAALPAALFPNFVHADEITLTTSKAVGDTIELSFFGTEFSGITVEGAAFDKKRDEGAGGGFCRGYYILESQTVKVSGNFTFIDCIGDSLTALDVSKCTGLNALYCDQNSLTALDLSKCTQLGSLSCGSNSLTDLDVSKCTQLEHLFCEKNSLTALDVGKCTQLQYLLCHENSLTALDVSKCTKLGVLFCGSNSLTDLDVSKCTELVELCCHKNLIKGKSMDDLIASLPDRNGLEYASPFEVYDLTVSEEQNICTTLQVEAARKRGWDPMAWNGQRWEEYPGSDPTGIDKTEIITDTDNVAIYDLEGRRHRQYRPGINIVKTTDGKTVKVMR